MLPRTRTSQSKMNVPREFRLTLFDMNLEIKIIKILEWDTDFSSLDHTLGLEVLPGGALQASKMTCRGPKYAFSSFILD